MVVKLSRQTPIDTSHISNLLRFPLKAEVMALFFLLLPVFTIMGQDGGSRLDSNYVEIQQFGTSTVQSINLDSIHTQTEIVSIPPTPLLLSLVPIVAAFVGAFFAGMVAVYSVRRSHKNALTLEGLRLKYEADRQLAIHLSVLFEMVGELDAHRMVMRDIAMVMPVLRDGCMEAIKFISPNIPYVMDFSHINRCRMKILEYDGCDPRLLGEIAAYVNSSKQLLNAMDFSPMLYMYQQVKSDERQLIEGIDGTFSALLEHMKKLVEFLPKLRRLIIDVIRTHRPGKVHEVEIKEEVYKMWDGTILKI